MDALLYWLARGALRLVEILPLRWVARLGRAIGAIVWALDARHRNMALTNLSLCFPEKAEVEIRALCIENFRRIGENFASAVRTSSMTLEELSRSVTFVAPELTSLPIQTQGRTVVAIGHFGNFELYARFGQFAPGFATATTYRGLRQPALNRFLKSLRQRSGCEFFDRRHDVRALKEFMSREVLLLGLLADQHAGDGGLTVPFFGHNCSTSASPAIFALRYRCRLMTAFCFRTALGQWRVETGAEVATHENGEARPLSDIMLDVNKAFEEAIRRDPANWFWVHNRWKLKWKLEGHRRGMPGPRRKPSTASSHA